MAGLTAFVQSGVAPQLAPALRGSAVGAATLSAGSSAPASLPISGSSLLCISAAAAALAAARKGKSGGVRRSARHVAMQHHRGDLVHKDELLKTVKALTMPGKGLLAMDESNKTCGQRLEKIGVENSELNRMRYRELLLGTKGLGEFCGGAILFEETLFQGTTDGKTMVQLCHENGVIPGIKVDKGLFPLEGGNKGEFWCTGLDGLRERTESFFKQGARFAKWRTTVMVRGHSDIAIAEAAHGLAHYASICQASGLVPIVEPEIILDGKHTIDETLEVFEKTWAAVFKALADFHVMFEGILLKPSMVTPGADCKQRSDAATIASYTLGALKRRVPPAVPGIMFLSGGQSEIEATENLNAMNQSPNPWHVSFSYARALQNSVLKTWLGKDENKVASQAKLLQRAQANSKAQLGKYDPKTAAEDAMAAEGMYVKNYTY